MNDILSIALVATPGLAGWQVVAALLAVCLAGAIITLIIGMELLRQEVGQ